MDVLERKLTGVRILGLMAGTSLDGIDAALCEIRGSGPSLRAELVAFECVAYSPELRERLLRACSNEADVREVARLNVEVAEEFAVVALKVLGEHGPAELIASHGQTIAHLPDAGATLQIGEGAVLAERTGLTVVCNFRARDMAAGGQGAPLVPYVDWALLRHPSKNRVVLNIGGIANCTILPAGCTLAEVRAWDTGPGNMTIDEGMKRACGETFDKDGALAAQGMVQPFELSDVHPFFEQTPPKTAGREQFGAAFVEANWSSEKSDADNIAFLTAVTATSIADSIERFSGFGEGDHELIVSGGGTHNATLMQMLARQVAPARVLHAEEVGIQSDAKEALAFAILGCETLHGVATNVPSATGAKEARVLGQIVPGENFRSLLEKLQR